MLLCTGQVQKGRGCLAFSVIIALLIVLSVSPFIHRAQAAQVTLAWDRNPDPSVIGYRLYYGAGNYSYYSMVDVGNSTQAVVSGLVSGVTYYFAVTDYNSVGESGFSNEVSYAVPADTSPRDSNGTHSGSNAGTGGGGGCFIATAAYGSSLAPEVLLLRKFRDDHLLTNAPGRLFVKLYCSLSPPLADFIRKDEKLRTATRLLLAPVVYAVKYPAAGFLGLVLLGICGFRSMTGRSRKFQ